jgi:hypothetical protein
VAFCHQPWLKRSSWLPSGCHASHLGPRPVLMHCFDDLMARLVETHRQGATAANHAGQADLRLHGSLMAASRAESTVSQVCTCRPAQGS